MEKVNLSELHAVPLTAAYWEVVYNGSGRVDFDSKTQEILLMPKAPQQTNPPSGTPQTFAALVILKQLKNNPLQDYVVRVEVSTEKQLRPEAPNDWEVFWFFGNYRLADKGTKEANYFILKPKSGLELGLVYDDVGQTFLKTANTPLLQIPGRDELIFIKRGTNFRVYRNQYRILDYHDGDSEKKLFHHGGTFGLYSEDAQVRIHSFSYKAL